MKILYIDHYAGSIKMGMEFRPFYFAREWQKRGHKVRIVGADFSHLRKENPEVERDFEIQVLDGVEYQWIKTGTYEGNGAARALTMFQFCTKLWRHASKLVKEFEPDVVISSSTYPLDALPAYRIKKLSGCRYVHEAHDLWPLTLTEIGGMSKYHPFVILLAATEKFAYKNSDAVVGVAPNEVEHMLEHGLQDKEKFTCIPNGIVLEDWENPEDLNDEHKALFDRLHGENKFIVCYLGGHALSNALDTLVDAARLTKDNDKIAYVLIGSGVEKAQLIKSAEGLSNIFFLPPVGKRQVPSALSEADVLYVGAVRSPLYRFGVSMNKVYDYMMAAKPILYGVEAFNNDVADAECGITIEPENPCEMINAINKIMGMSSSQRTEMGKKGQDKVLSSYEYSVLAETFLTVLGDNANIK